MNISVRREEGQLIFALTAKGNSSDTSFADMHQQALRFGEAEITYPRIAEVLIRDENNFLAWLVQILRKNISTFNYLGINNYLMDSDKCKLIGDALRQNTVITELELHNFAAQGADITPIINSIANSTSLEVLSLELERSQTTEWKLLGEALMHQKSITELSVDTKNPQGISVHSDDAFSFVLRILKHNTTITSLRLFNLLDLSHEEFNYFCEILTTNTLLKRLTLTVKVNSVGFLDPFCKYLRTTKTLKRLCLYLSNDAEHEKDIGRLVQALSVNSSLTSLNFDCKVVPKHFFSTVVEENSNLRSLIVHRIANDDLIEVIKTTTSLTNLVFFPNELGLGDSEEMLKLALENNYSLRSGSFNRVDELGKRIFQRNTELHKQWYQQTALSIHVLVRSHLFGLLPTELWIVIFSKINYPGLESFEPLAKSILKMYQRS